MPIGSIIAIIAGVLVAIGTVLFIVLKKEKDGNIKG